VGFLLEPSQQPAHCLGEAVLDAGFAAKVVQDMAEIVEDVTCRLLQTVDLP
jgi:hypothetical protein